MDDDQIDDFDPRDAYPFIDKVMAESDAHDPLLDSYQSMCESDGI